MKLSELKINKPISDTSKFDKKYGERYGRGSTVIINGEEYELSKETIDAMAACERGEVISVTNEEFEEIFHGPYEKN